MQNGGRPNDLGARTVDYALGALMACATLLCGSMPRKGNKAGAASTAPRPSVFGG